MFLYHLSVSPYAFPVFAISLTYLLCASCVSLTCRWVVPHLITSPLSYLHVFCRRPVTLSVVRAIGQLSSSFSQSRCPSTTSCRLHSLLKHHIVPAYSSSFFISERTVDSLIRRCIGYASEGLYLRVFCQPGYSGSTKPITVLLLTHRAYSPQDRWAIILLPSYWGA